MKFEVLPQKLHDGEVLTVDINSSNELIATGGIDNSIHIWKLQSIIQADVAQHGHSLLIAPDKTINIHNATVTAARWSPKQENILVSGDQAGFLYITNTTDETSELIYPWPVIESEAKPIVDGAWSSDGRIFAWSTSDCKVHIFDTMRNTYQTLMNETKDEKTSVQRSIAFDPSNNYLVTIGDDTLVHIYQYYYKDDEYQFKALLKISKLMNNNTTVVHGLRHRRISWSCDGEFFAVPNASKQQTALISLLSKSQGWENKTSFVGHDMECDVVQFAPHIFQSEPGDLDFDSSKHDVYHMVASAGLDRTLVLWNTSKESPVFVLRDITSKPISDLVWDCQGEYLFFVTMDGSLGVVSFEAGELGSTISPSLLLKLQESQIKSAKPFSLKAESDAGSAKKAKVLADTISQSDATKIQEAFSEEKPIVKVDSVEQDEKEKLEQDQVEKKHSGEIIPTVLLPTSDKETDSADMLHSAMKVRESSSEVTARPKLTAAPTKVNASSVQKVTTKNGKRRIQPVLISNGQDTASADQESNLTLPKRMNSDIGSKKSKTLMEFDKPSYSVTEEVQKEHKRNKQQDEGGPSKKFKRDLVPIKFVGSVVLNPTTTFAKVRLSAPRVRMSFGVTTRGNSDTYLDIKNGQGNETAPSRVTCFKKDLQIWTDFIPKYIQLATEGKDFWAVCTADGQIMTYSHVSGKRVLPPMVMGSPLSFLESHEKYLMAVTVTAEIFVWDMELKKLHMSSPLSLSNLLELNNKFEEDTLSKTDNITMCSITSKGIPLVTLSNGSGFLYNIDMGVWNTVSEAWWAFGSHYWDSIADDKTLSEPRSSGLLGREAKSSLVGMLEHKTNEEILRKSRVGRGKFFNKISKNMIMKEGFENLENTVSLSHLENRILCCEILGEESDFHDFLIVYVKRICELGFKAKLYEICEQLMGGDQATKICGYDKRALLKEIILSCAESRDAQRILVHFGKRLGMIESDY